MSARAFFDFFFENRNLGISYFYLDFSMLRALKAAYHVLQIRIKT